jgi:recombination protein RecR
MTRPDVIKKVIELLQHLPGIGPRQAERFAYALIDMKAEAPRALGESLIALAAGVTRCQECMRVVETGHRTCATCADGAVRHLIVVEKDQDIDAFERSGITDTGFHLLRGFILGGPDDAMVRDRIRSLYARIETLLKNPSDASVEITLAFAATADGDMTAAYITKILEPLASQKLSITRLGRGLSTGSELEYADRDTIKNAFASRNKTL